MYKVFVHYPILEAMYCCTAFTHALTPVRTRAITVLRVRLSRSIGIARIAKRKADTKVLRLEIRSSLVLVFILVCYIVNIRCISFDIVLC